MRRDGILILFMSLLALLVWLVVEFSKRVVELLS
jgi:Na+-transporting methylmalonyl-CoA/oxaloacetate decarboxylase gamma subunit